MLACSVAENGPRKIKTIEFVSFWEAHFDSSQSNGKHANCLYQQAGYDSFNMIAIMAINTSCSIDTIEDEIVQCVQCKQDITLKYTRFNYLFISIQTK